MSELPKINEVYIIKDDKDMWQLCKVVRVSNKVIPYNEGWTRCVVKHISGQKSFTVTADRLHKIIDGKSEHWMYKKNKTKTKGRVK